MYKSILLAVDGSEASTAAANSAIELAKALRAELNIYHALEPIEALYFEEAALLYNEFRTRMEEEQTKAAKRLLGELKAKAEAQGLSCRTILERVLSASDAIVHAAEKQGCGLIVMGSRGLGALAGALLGSTTYKVLHAAKRPVLVIS